MSEAEPSKGVSVSFSGPQHQISMPSSSPSTSKKRKGGTTNHGGSNKKGTANKQRIKKIKLSEDDTIDIENSVSLAIGRMDHRLLTDYVAGQTKRFASNLSLVELEDEHIPEKAFLDTSAWEQPRLLPNLPDFLDRYAPRSGKPKNLSSASKKAGTPHTIVITSSGLRAADVTRALRTFQTKDATVAKLFAKHVKLKNAIEYVKKTRMGIGVGTPSRLIDLLDAGALSLEKLERLVVDCSHIDQKQRGILDMKDTQRPLMRLLNRGGLKDRYGTDIERVDLIFY